MPRRGGGLGQRAGPDGRYCLGVCGSQGVAGAIYVSFDFLLCSAGSMPLFSWQIWQIAILSDAETSISGRFYKT